MVVAYHNFPVTAHGGFIGVDIFFVISGFLITSIIAEDIEEGRFSFAGFYARRARRIFPALAIVLLACLSVGSISLDPSEYKALALQVTAGAGFLSNMLLWSQSGYFDEFWQFKPLLHLWSLAIEEQFYILWPLALYLCTRWKRPLWALAVGFAGASFTLNLYLSQVDRVADFYFVLSRIWELLIGAALALLGAQSVKSHSVVSNAAAAVGLALIVGGLMTIHGDQAFPGWRALLPTVGATLLIAAGPHTLINTYVFSNRAMVWLGKISYPIYLWHWPLIAFARIREGGNVGPPLRWALIVAAIGLSYLTYRFLEKPIRFGPGRARAATAAFAILALGIVGLVDFWRGGLLFPNAVMVTVVNEGDLGGSEFADYFKANSKPCPWSMTPSSAKDALACGQSKTGEQPRVVILGDSHAHHLFPGLAEALAGKDVAYATALALPLLDHPMFAPIFKAIAGEPKVQAVILSASWMAKVGELPEGVSLRVEMDRVAEFLRAAGKDVYIVTDVPGFPFQPGRCKFAGRLGMPALCIEPEAALEWQLATYAPDLQAVAAAHAGVHFIDVSHAFCADAVCSMALNGKLLYRDGAHLNLNGSRLIGQEIVAEAPELTR